MFFLVMLNKVVISGFDLNILFFFLYKILVTILNNIYPDKLVNDIVHQIIIIFFIISINYINDFHQKILNTVNMYSYYDYMK